MKVSVAPLGEAVKCFNVGPGTKVGEVLKMAEIDPIGKTVRLNNIEAGQEDEITEDDSLITIAKGMKGGKGV